MYFRTGVKVNDEKQYLIPECLAEFLEEHIELVFNYNGFYKEFYDVLTNYVQFIQKTGTLTAFKNLIANCRRFFSSFQYISYMRLLIRLQYYLY